MIWRKHRELSTREKFLLLLLLVVAGLSFVHRVVLRYQLPHYLQVKKELTAESARLAAVQEAALKLPLLKEELAQAEAEMSMAKARLGLTLRDKESFLAAAQPKNEGVRILLFRPLEAEKRGGFNVQPFQVSAEGVYPQVENYLQQLENLPALIQIRDLKLTAKPGSHGEVEASFILDFYELGEKVANEGKAVTLLPLGRSDIFLPPADFNKPSSHNFFSSSKPSSTPSPVVSSSGGTGEGTRLENKGKEDKDQSETLEYTFPARGHGRSRAGAPWLEGIRVLRNVGPFYYPADRAIAIGGRQFEHGIVVDLGKSRLKAEAVLDLQAGYLKLRGFIGVEDGTRNSSGSFILRIIGDERELFTSPPLKPGGYPQYVEINVTGVNRLTIQVEWKEAGPGDYSDLKAALADMFLSTT